MSVTAQVWVNPTINQSNNSPVGIWITESTSIAEVFDQLIKSIGGWWSFTRLGALTGGVLLEPDYPLAYITIDDIVSIERVAGSGAGTEIPNSTIELSYKKNYTIQSGDELAGLAATDQERVSFVKDEYRKISISDTIAETQYPLSTPLVQLTLLNATADATTEATRLLNLMKERRDFLRIGLSADHAIGTMDIGQVVNLTIPRFGYTGGKNFVIIGFEEWQPKPGQIVVQLWG